MDHEKISDRRIEEAALNSWPALKQVWFDGWAVRFANGYTKRANSVNCIHPSTLDVESKISYCETLYKNQNLPPIFRLTPLAPENLDRLLQERGYVYFDPSQVMHLDLKEWDERRFPVAQTTVFESLDRWLSEFSRLSQSDNAKRRSHLDILESIVPDRHLFAVSAKDVIVACGMGVLERDVFGLFDIVTDSERRKKGYGTALVVDMLRHAKACGAAHATLQVVQGNAAAVGLYEKVGFRKRYPYWYRVRPHVV